MTPGSTVRCVEASSTGGPDSCDPIQWGFLRSLEVMTELGRRTPTMSALIVVVNADPKTLRRTEQLLSEAGYMTAAAPTFAAGRDLLRSVRPDLLVADVRLEAFNGLQLAAYCSAHYPGMPTVITHTQHDPVLERDAGRLGATFIVNPLTNAEFLPNVHSSIAAQTGTALAPQEHFRDDDGATRSARRVDLRRELRRDAAGVFRRVRGAD